MLHNAEKFGYDLLDRFPSLIEGETVSVFGRKFDYAFFVTSSLGPRMNKAVFNGKINEAFNPLPAWFNVGDGLTLFLELDSMFMSRRKAMLGGHSETVLSYLKTTLLTFEEINAFYRGRAKPIGEFGMRYNLASLGKCRASELPREWRV